MNMPIALGTVLIFLAAIGIAGSWVLPLLVGGLALVAFGAYVVPVKPPPVKPLQDDERYV